MLSSVLVAFIRDSDKVAQAQRRDVWLGQEPRALQDMGGWGV